MYDFLDSRLNPSVTTSTPCTDGYEITNLISDRPELKSKGFLAYSAIKPPVEIDFTFTCPINVSYIIIWPTVCSQKSTGFEILMKDTSSSFVTICRSYIREAGLVACSRRVYNERQNKPSYPSDFAVRYFKSSEYRSFVSCSKVRLRIFHTASSVPCINRIEIWGKPSDACTVKTKETINRLMHKKEETITRPTPPITNPTKPDISDIPEEFLDTLTYEIMSLPMTLPSGKTIDQSTLEKHHSSEAKWGRMPSDPFTGQAFTRKRRPILNVALKCRIDDFLLKNSHREDVKNVPRTAGTVKTLNRNSEVRNKRQRMDVVPSSSHSNLDELIQNTITNYNIVRYSTIEPEVTVLSQCGQCKSTEGLYELKCTHLLCRKCLTMNLDHKCVACNKQFLTSDVKKFHDKRL